jgi:high-affinity iron transporter
VTVIANALIGLREGLEASLVVAMLVAAVVRTGHRDALRPLWLGVASAVLVSLGVGALLTWGPSDLTFEAQEAVGGTLSIVAVALVTWMIFWMARASRTMRSHLSAGLGTAIGLGPGAVFSLGLLTVGREGLETTLFLWASARASGTSIEPLIGALLGLGAAAVLGLLFYRGALKIDLSKFFALTGGFLVVVAAGVLAYGVHDLQEAGIVPGLTQIAFDVSGTIPPSSWYGTLLTGIFAVSPVTTWYEAGTWAAYLAPTLALFIRSVRRPQPVPLPAA